MKKLNLYVILAVAAMALGSNVLGGVLQVEDITISMGAPTFYTQASGFAIDSSAITADIRLFGASDYEYRINNTSVSVTACQLINDNSSGGFAEGDFAGGGTLTVTGDLVEVLADGSDGAIYATGITILEAVMVKDSTETWALVEDSSQPMPVPNRLGASVDFTPSNGGLNAGINVGNGDILKIDEFNCGFSFTNVMTTPPITSVENFSEMFMIGTQTSLQIRAIPEPCSILLMAVGGVGLLRNRKKYLL